MRLFLSVFGLGRPQQKNRFDPPQPALTHSKPFSCVPPRYARLHSTEWFGMNLQKEIYTPSRHSRVTIIFIFSNEHSDEPGDDALDSTLRHWAIVSS
jgi:hypothetical protein